jgi:hypothetical protein
MIDKDKTKELMEKSLDFIKETSGKIRKEARRKWKVSNLKLEIASLKHQMGLHFKDLGKYLYEATKEDNLDKEKYESFFIKLGGLEEKIEEKTELIKKIEEEVMKEKTEKLFADDLDSEEVSQYKETTTVETSETEAEKEVEAEAVTETEEKENENNLDKEAVDKETEIADS